jgi:chemotaxis family two-component system response regulator Rcp1
VTDLPTPRSFNILLVEDNLGDVRLIQEALKEAQVANTMHVVGDGVAALDFLYRRDGFEAAPRPDLILMDLNLPRKNGHEVLEQIKQEPLLKSIPVVILTSSHAAQDIDCAYQLHANCYITKPVEFMNYNTVVRAIEKFWFTIVTLPAK